MNDVRFGLSPKHLLLILLIESERVTLVKSHPKNASSPISTTLVGMVKLGAWVYLSAIQRDGQPFMAAEIFKETKFWHNQIAIFGLKGICFKQKCQ